MNLNIGCGEFRAPGFINIDLHRNGPKPDLIATATALPFRTGIFGRIYCGHVLEHIHPDAINAALNEMRRVLRPDGQLLVIGPDLDRARTSDLRHVICHGGHRWPGDEHQWASTERDTLIYLKAAGWSAIPIPVSQAPQDRPVVSRVEWQTAILATVPT